MSRKSKNKNTYKAKPYEPFESCGYMENGTHYFKSAISGEERLDTTATMTMSMLLHPAFKDLKPRQRMLYVYAKSQFRGMTDREQFEEHHEKYKGNNLYFYLNHKLMIDVFELYGKHSKKELYADITALIEHGFIEAVERENNQRTIYKFCSEWHNWTPYQKYVSKPKGNGYEWIDIKVG